MARQPLYMLMMLAAGASYGVISPILRLAYAQGYSVQDITDLQYIIAAVVFWALTLLRRRKVPISRRQWILMFAIGICNAAVSYCYYVALTVLPSSFGIVLLFQFAWMAVLIDIIVKRKFPSLMKWLGLLFVIVGTFFAVGLTHGAVHPYPWWTYALGLVAALAYALSLYLSEYNDQAVSPQFRSAVIMTVAMLVIFIPFPPVLFTSGAVLKGALPWGAYVALFSQILPTFLIMVSIPKIGGRMAAILGTIELPIAVFGSFAMNGEYISPLRWFGVALILFGILASEATELRKRDVLEVAAESETGIIPTDMYEQTGSEQGGRY